MTYTISDDCIACGVCEGECPEGAISLGQSHFQIDTAKCENCGSCADVCPVGAPQPDEE
jgi:ferredoxin